MSIEVLPVGTRCNMACRHCYETNIRDAGNQSNGEYDMDAMKAALAKEGYAFTVFGGEPLLTPIDDIEELWRWGFEQYGRNSVQTAATLVTDRHFELFRKYNVHVGISLEGPGELNDIRHAGSLERTREATDRAEGVLHQLLEERQPVSLITTLNRANATPERLPRLLDWYRDLSRRGLRSCNLHLMEIENERVRQEWALTEEENATALLACADLQTELQLRFQPITDMTQLLLGRDEWDGGGVSCIWNACDPYTTRAVQGINGQGQKVNCSRTNKAGVDMEKADRELFVRPLALFQVEQEHGGCGGCRFWLMCKGHCYDEETEVLTERGFVYFAHLSEDDKLASMDPDTRIVKYEKPLRRFGHPYVGTMLRFEAQGYDLLVTPNHPMLAWDQQERLVEAPSSEWRSGLRVRKSGTWVGTAKVKHKLVKISMVPGKEWCTPTVESVRMDAWLEFLGWYIAEGCATRTPQARGWLYDVSISNKDLNVISRLQDLLRSFGFKPCIRHNANGVDVVSVKCKQLYEEVVPLGDAFSKRAPDYVKELPPKQIRIFLEAVFAGDGASRPPMTGGYARTRRGTPRWECYYTVSRGLADDIQELLLKVGLSGTVVLREARAGRIGERTFVRACSYEVYVRHERNYCSFQQPIAQQYKGTVYDVTMPKYPTIYVRRNGKAVWAHNCPGESEQGDWRRKTEHCGVLLRVFGELEVRLSTLGFRPVSADSARRVAAENRMVESFQQGHLISVREALNENPRASGDRPHGDAPHGDSPHGDSEHGDHNDAQNPIVTHGDHTDQG